MNLPFLVIPIILHRKLAKYGYDPSCSKLHKSLISLLVSGAREELGDIGGDPESGDGSRKPGALTWPHFHQLQQGQ